MRTRRWLLALWMAGLLVGTWSTGQVPIASAATLTVCPSGCQYTDIPSAITAASNGDTISIGPGTYTGGITVNKSLTLTGSTSGPATVSGGGPVITVPSGVSVTLTNLTITGGNNSDGVSGGGGIANSGTLTVTNSTISGNSAVGSGAGVYNTGTAVLINSTISGNVGQHYGGGVGNFGSLSATNATISNNTAAQGGGINNRGSSAVLVNTLLAGNTNTVSVGPDCYGTITETAAGHNLVGNNTNCNTAALTNGDQVGTNAAPIDPKLAPLANNGGPTQTMALLPSSPAIGGGDATTCKALVGPDGVTTDVDQRGQPRKSATRGDCDIGAYDTGHLPTTYYVDASASNGDSVPCSANASTNPFQTIPYALTCATNGDIVTLAAGSYAGGFTLNRSVKLVGATTGSSIVSGGGPVITVAAGVAATITSLTVTGGNTVSGDGGGIYNSGTLTVTNSTISGNHADNNGGGMYNGGTLSVATSTISGNTVSYGDAGGMDNHGSLTVTNSTISGNSARYSGGMHNSGTMSVTNSTISGNSAGQTGGIYNQTGSVILGNTILAHNNAVGSPDGHGRDCFGTLTDLPGGHGHNLIGDGSFVDALGGTHSCGFTNSVNGDQVGNANAPLDPKLAALASNGGPTQTMTLLPGSPAVDTGDATTCRSTGATGVNDLDQRGQPRKSALRGNCDVGAYDTGHVPATFYVNPTGNDSITCSANTAGNPFRTVAQVLSSCANNNDSIILAGGNPALNYLGGFTISSSVKLVGPGTGAATIIGPSGSSVITISAGPNVSISGVTITHNAQTTGNTGAGIVNFGNLTLRTSTVTQNTGTCGYGGIYNDNASTMTIQNSTISQNTSVSSACAGVGTGGIFSRGSLTVAGSTISGNTGGTYAGGLYTDANATLHLTNSTVTGNSASNGGGIMNFGTTTIVNTTISGNNATTGGGIYNPGATASTLANTVLAGNTATLQGPDCAGSLTDGAGHNLLGITGTGSDCTYTPGPNDQVGTIGSPLDPMLGALAGNGGPTQTMALQTGSPAINHGDFATCFNAPINDLDQRGYQRGSSVRASCDIGAYDTYGDTHVVTIQAAPGWALIGGSPLTLLPDATVSWSWNALTGAWTQPAGTEPGGTGAWEELATGGSEAINIQDCATAPSIPVQAHRWNLIGNPCKQTVQLPSGARALLLTGTTYTISQTIPPGLAAWVLPASTPLTLTPTG